MSKPQQGGVDGTSCCAEGRWAPFQCQAPPSGSSSSARMEAAAMAVQASRSNPRRRLSLSQSTAHHRASKLTRAVKIGDIKSDKKCLHIPFGKGSTERMAPLPDRVIHYLRSYFKNIWPQPASWLFYGASADEPMSAAALHRAFKKARERVGIGPCHSFHSLRHSAATHLLERGGNIEVIRDALGASKRRHDRDYARATGKMFEALDHPLSGFPIPAQLNRRGARACRRGGDPPLRRRPLP